MPLFYGTNLRAVADPLRPIAPDRLYTAISRPKPASRERIEQLRQVYALDPRRYADRKRELPYFCGATFHPAVRRKENFAALEYFVVDLDHFDADNAPDLESTRQALRQRPDLVLLFVSPSGNGLKLLFRLAEPYRDPNLYRLFYQAFIQRLAADHGLESVIDTRTHDVSRVCFFSYDPRAWFAPDARAVDGSAYADPADPDLEHRLAAGRAELRDQQPAERDDATAAGGPDDTTLLAIKQRLNPRYRPPRPRNAHAPAKIEALLPDLEAYLAENDLRLVSAESIQYGKQLRVAVDPYWAEINEALAEVQAAYDNEDSILLIPVQAATVGSMKIIGKDIQIQSLVDPPNTLFY